MSGHSTIAPQQAVILGQAQTFWLQWVEAAFPDLDFRAYFLPPVHVNRVPMTRESVCGQDVLVLQSAAEQAGQQKQHVVIPTAAAQASISQPPRVQDSDIRDDAAMQRVLFCLKNMFQMNREALIGISQLQFKQYLAEPLYAAAAAQLPLPSSLPPALPRNWKQGDFDVLLIHRNYGLVVFEVKSFGHNVDKLNMSQQDIDNVIRNKLKEAVSQLNKAEAMLSHLVSDVCPGLRITKTIAVPNLTTDQVQQAISGDLQLSQDLCRCLGITNPADIAGLCLCSDQLFDHNTPWGVYQKVLCKLENWWKQQVAGAGSNSNMTSVLYKTLIARFCGPATTVSVPCTSPPRVSVKTLGQAVWCTGECYTAVITLFPEQVDLLNTACPRLFLAGPPGTGKTVVLILKGLEWLRRGNDVYIMSTWIGSFASCTLMYHLLLYTIKTQQTAGTSPGQLRFINYDFGDQFDPFEENEKEDIEKAVNELSQAAKGESLYVIADEVTGGYFKTFCERLLTRVPRLHLWAASFYHGDAPHDWRVGYLTRPLRSPPAVLWEVECDEHMTEHNYVQSYSNRGVPDHTDGPPVKDLYHKGEGHSGRWPGYCVTCGREVASFLHSLRVGVTENVTTTSTTIKSTTSRTPPCLQWRDVLMLHYYHISESGILKGLREAGVPVRLVECDEDIEDVATARSDVVWVALRDQIRGLERKVVVCLQSYDDLNARLFSMSRSV